MYFMPDQINIMVPGWYFHCGGRLKFFKSAECVLDRQLLVEWPLVIGHGIEGEGRLLLLGLIFPGKIEF